MADGWFDITSDEGLPWCGFEPGAELATVIAETDPDDLPGPARVSYLAACDRLNSWVQAQTALAINSVASATMHMWSEGNEQNKQADHEKIKQADNDEDKQADNDEETQADNDEGAGSDVIEPELSQSTPRVDVDDLTTRVDQLSVAEQVALNEACALPPAAWIADEIAAALHIAPVTATRRLDTASLLCQHYNRLWAALEAGQITWSQCLAMLEVINSWNTDPDDGVTVECDLEHLADAVLDVVLPTASNYPPARLRERTRHALTRLAPEIAAARRARATRKRTGISVWNAGDGLATLSLTGPAVDVHALTVRIRSHAQALSDIDSQQREPDHASDADASEERTIGQWHLAAIMTSVGLAPIGIPPATTDATTADGARAIPGLDIRIVIDLPTALGLAHNPGDLPGYGPLDPDLARALACSGDWTRWITDPVTGHLLDDGDRRLPTASLARFIQARDARCDAPSCSRTTRLDIDHVPTYATARRTSADTLTRTCVRHNRSREKAKWKTPEHREWVSALGRRYTTIVHQPLPRFEIDEDPPPF